MDNKNRTSLGLAFSVGITAFAAHAGGGFATGNQANTYFVSLGWVGIFSALLAMLVLALSVREGQLMWNITGSKSYKELFAHLFHPFDKLSLVFDVFYDIMILMVVASCIAGVASALKTYFGLDYYVGAVLVGIVILLLSIFGAEIIRKANTYMGICILVLSLVIYCTGLLKSTDFAVKFTNDLAAQGASNIFAAVKNALIYAGFQWVTIPAVLACGTVLKTKKDCTAGMIFTFVFNCLGLGISVIMLYAWSDYFMNIDGGSTLPTLSTLMHMDMGFLVVLYVAALFLCMVSSGVAVVFGFINRFENSAFLNGIKNTHVKRSGIAVFIMAFSMFISFAGLTNVVKYGYGYCGYLGLFGAALPLLTVGFYKNRKWLRECSDGNRILPANASDSQEEHRTGHRRSFSGKLQTAGSED